MKSFFSFILEVAKIVIIALAIVMPIRYFLFQPFIVRGQSMEPNFSDGDYLIIDELSYRLRDPQRGEIIVFRSPTNPSSRYIKRIIGLPGETVKVKGGQITIYIDDSSVALDEDYLPGNLETSGDLQISLSPDQYFVLGDNRSASYDSRKFGPLIEGNIIGRVYFRAWPFSDLDRIEVPIYQYD
jgi:signal peptidase I